MPPVDRATEESVTGWFQTQEERIDVNKLKAEGENLERTEDAASGKREVAARRQLVTKLRRRGSTWFALPQLESVSCSEETDNKLNVKEKRAKENISSNNEKDTFSNNSVKKNKLKENISSNTVKEKISGNKEKENNVHVCDVCFQLHEIASYRPLPTECDKCWIKTFVGNILLN